MIQKTKNQKLNKAKKEKNDEFYTLLVDLEHEVPNYWPEIEKLEKELGRKVRIWCNCDDPKWSNFYKYFKAQTHYHPQYEVKFTSYNLIPDNISGYEKKILEKEWIKKNSKGEIETFNYCYVDSDGYCQGDFRAKEQIKDWEWADIIITNPPFSLFREFMSYIMKYNKKFLIVGAKIAMSYKEITKLIVDKKIWCGINLLNNFKDTENKISNAPACWYTNLKTPIENRTLTLCYSYKEEPELYKKADNMDVLYVNKTNEIPYDYDGAMAVPITFMFKYNPNQFEILCDSRYYHKGWNNAFDMIVDGKRTFRRFIIKNKKVESREK